MTTSKRLFFIAPISAAMLFTVVATRVLKAHGWQICFVVPLKLD
ncbi:hypothetical protein [Ruegeria arenilitoris]|nr:hypothetical protein [Ruegeria arenilitoris]